MKCPSLFHFYRAYMGGESTGKVHFARAIQEMDKQLERIYHVQDPNGYAYYSAQPRSHGLTKRFLQNFYELADKDYGDKLFQSMRFFRNRITIPKTSIGKRELYIPFSYCYVINESKMVFFEYGRVDDARLWLPIFKTLSLSFPLEHSLPDPETVTYWDLLKGNAIDLPYHETKTVPRARLLFTARKIVEDAVGRRR